MEYDDSVQPPVLCEMSIRWQVAAATEVVRQLRMGNCYLIFPLSAAPALNLTDFLAGITMVCFVAGFTPLRSLRSVMENVPKPIRDTGSSFDKAFFMISNTASTAFLASTLVNWACSATAAANSVFVILIEVFG